MSGGAAVALTCLAAAGSVLAAMGAEPAPQRLTALLQAHPGRREPATGGLSASPPGATGGPLDASQRASGQPSRDPAARLGGRSPTRPELPRQAAMLLAGVALALLVGGAAGVVAGLATAVVLDRVIRTLPAQGQEARNARLRSDLPLALDLLAGALAAGAPVSGAVEAVAAALPGPLGDELGAVATALRLGAGTSQAWARCEAQPPLRAVARAVVRGADSGAALAPLARQLAADQRVADRATAEAAARRVGVLVVAPLGACFLPAFLLLGVVPIVLSLAGSVLQ